MLRRSRLPGTLAQTMATITLLMTHSTMGWCMEVFTISTIRVRSALNPLRAAFWSYSYSRPIGSIAQQIYSLLTGGSPFDVKPSSLHHGP